MAVLTRKYGRSDIPVRQNKIIGRLDIPVRQNLEATGRNACPTEDKQGEVCFAHKN